MITMITTTNFVIVNGPSKSDLFAAFLTAYVKKPNKPFLVTFEVKDNPDHPDFTHKRFARIGGLAYEDGSGESFLISGIIHAESANQRDQRFNGYFNTKSRTGCINIL